MRYVGSKFKIASKLLDEIGWFHETWVEPFCGGLGLAHRVAAHSYILADIHRPLINMYKAYAQGWQPPNEVGEDLYRNVREAQWAYPDELVAFIGFGCSFSGKYFGGYAKDSNGRNYAEEAANLLAKKMLGIKHAQFIHCDYRELEIPEGATVYCDPPYANTLGYGLEFDTRAFWDWVLEQGANGRTVYVSEYTAPAWMEEVLRLDKPNCVRAGTAINSVEKLFKTPTWL